jgi:hypothetical protein
MTIVDPVILLYEVMVSQESINTEEESPIKPYDLELEMDDIWERCTII